ncbi:hypothetical protein BS78_01G287700 [Paspalum vaginatum]|nr:hypothetical protein BS78_01G287700 [Paspalum vaginatum]
MADLLARLLLLRTPLPAPRAPTCSIRARAAGGSRVAQFPTFPAAAAAVPTYLRRAPGVVPRDTVALLPPPASHVAKSVLLQAGSAPWLPRGAAAGRGLMGTARTVCFVSAAASCAFLCRAPAVTSQDVAEWPSPHRSQKGWIRRGAVVRRLRTALGRKCQRRGPRSPSPLRPRGRSPPS